MNNTNVKPWETPRIRRIIELFGGKVMKIKVITNKVEVKHSEIDR